MAAFIDTPGRYKDLRHYLRRPISDSPCKVLKGSEIASGGAERRNQAMSTQLIIP